MAFAWDESLALGVAEIDEQHREIFARFDKLSLACQEQHGGDQLKELMLFLDEYVASHFAEEEALMEKTGYPGLAVQREQHAQFRQEIEVMHARIADQSDLHRLSLEIDRRLIQWFVQHIRNLDSLMASFVQNENQR